MVQGGNFLPLLFQVVPIYKEPMFCLNSYFPQTVTCQRFPNHAILECNRLPTSVSSHSFHNWSDLTTALVTSITKAALDFNMRYLKTSMTHFFDQHCLLSAILFSPEIFAQEDLFEGLYERAEVTLTGWQMKLLIDVRKAGAFPEWWTLEPWSRFFKIPRAAVWPQLIARNPKCQNLFL